MRRLDSDFLEMGLRQLYGHLADGAPLMDALGPVSQLLRCHIVGLHLDDPASNSSEIRVAGPASLSEVEQLIEEYNRNWKGKNEWLRRGMQLLARHGYSDGDDCVSEAELREIPYFAKFLVPLDIRHGFAFLVNGSVGSSSAVISFNRPASAGFFDECERSAASVLLDNLRSAFRISQTLELLKYRCDFLEGAVESAGVGIVILNADSEIVHLNGLGHNLLLEIGVEMPSLVGSRVRFKRRHTNDWLASARRRCFHEKRACGPVIVVSYADSQSRSTLELIPLGSSSVACLLLRRLDLAGPGSRDEAVLAAAFGFTEAESKVVCMLLCLGAADRVASRLGVSLATVRTHIQHAFFKAGVAKQTELAILAERVLGRARA